MLKTGRDATKRIARSVDTGRLKIALARNHLCLENGKGCDIDYAPAARSCEGANSVEVCTVAALDAITAFAVPNPNCPSQSRRFFRVWSSAELPRLD